MPAGSPYKGSGLHVSGYEHSTPAQVPRIMANYWCNVIQCRMGLGCKNTLIKDANTILKLYLYFFAVNTASNVKKIYSTKGREEILRN